MSDITGHQVFPSVETERSSATLPPLGLQNNSGAQSTKNSIANNASATADAIKNHPMTQNITNGAASAADAIVNHPITQSVANGPVAENIKDQTAKTSNEFSNLAATRTTPSNSAANGQQLTHYHSFFSSLLSWEHPRASGIAYAAIVAFIFAARYLNIIRYSFKLTYVVLGVTVLAEVAGKALFGNGLTSQVRPKKYYTVSKSTLNAVVGDVHELINFFVIEAQQIVFAENVLVSAAAFIGAFISYYLIKVVPFWGLSLIGTSVLFLGPLIYKTNKELIDANLNRASNIINQQTNQVKHLATQQAARATETTKTLVGDYSAKAQDLIGNARARSTSPVATTKPAKTGPFDSKKENVPSYKNENVSSFKNEDFPVAPVAPIGSNTAFPAAPKGEFKSTPIAEEFNSTQPIVKDDPLILS